MAQEEEYVSDNISRQDSKKLQSYWNSSDFDSVFGSSYWTRITVVNGACYDKETVLKCLLTSVHPVEVSPCLYQIDGRDSFFLVRNCSLFIRKLALNNLQLTDSCGRVKFEFAVTTYYLPTSLEPLNPQFQLTEALKKRTSKEHKTIDLTNLSQDILLKDVYFSLTIMQCMHQLMTLIRNEYKKWTINKPTTLILQHNNFTSIDHLELELKYISYFKNIDLRHNELTWESLERLSPLRLNKLWLDGNPLCSGITEAEYVSRSIRIFGPLKQLDGVDVSHTFLTDLNKDKKIALIKNYICDPSWSNFADHFCHHYFSLMESPNRHQLARMYHQKATFSFSACQNPAMEVSDWNILSKYLISSRNLLTLSDINKAYSTLIVGPENIVEIFNSFPVIQFDPFSFTIEVPIAKKEMVLINISGIFQELNSGLFSFNRTFVVTPYTKSEAGEWKISNDMLYITVATQEQAEESFSKARMGLSPQMKLNLNPTTNDKDTLVPAMCELTKLTNSWSAKMLEEASWDFERALLAFVDQLKSNQIPMIAFSV